MFEALSPEHSAQKARRCAAYMLRVSEKMIKKQQTQSIFIYRCIYASSHSDTQAAIRISTVTRYHPDCEFTFAEIPKQNLRGLAILSLFSLDEKERKERKEIDRG